MIGALLWIPAFAGMTGESFAGMMGETFAGMAGGQRRNGRGEFCGDGGIHGCRSP